MSAKRKQFIIILFPIVLLSSCISIDISKAPEKSSQVNVKNPPSGFKRVHSPHLDALWKHPYNGNSISYLSECSDEEDSSLEKILRDTTKSLEKINVEKQSYISLKHQRALSSTFEAQVDGALSKINITALKKNSCIYIITYLGLPRNYPKNLQDYQEFLEGFQIK